MDSVMKSPKVTVLMSVYNGETYLRDAMDSILSQDFTDFEFLIINDGSKDDSEKIIRSYKDDRIRLIMNEKNIGLVNSLNKGFELAQGEYIVRMDCDDISHKNRLSTQVRFMDSHLSVGASGSFHNLLLNGKKAVADFPLKNDEIKCYMLFNSPIAHPAVIIRNSIIKKEKLLYRSEYIHAEDYDLWSQLSEIADLANVSDVLLNYRVHENQITKNQKLILERQQSMTGIRTRHLKKINIIPSPEEMKLHHLVSDGSKPESSQQLIDSEIWLKKILTHTLNNKQFDSNSIGKIVLERWLRVCFNYYGGKKGFQYFLGSELYSMIKLPFSKKLEFFKNLYYSYKRKAIKN